MEINEMMHWLQELSPNQYRKREAFLQVDVLILDNVEILREYPNGSWRTGTHAQFLEILQYRAAEQRPTMMALWTHPTEILHEITSLQPDKTRIVEMIAQDYRQRPKSEKT